MTKLEEIARATVHNWSRIGGDVYDDASDLSAVKVDGVIDFLAVVRGIVIAMREPTGAMIVASAQSTLGREFSVQVWRSMCDAILAEADKPDAPPV